MFNQLITNAIEKNKMLNILLYFIRDSLIDNQF